MFIIDVDPDSGINMVHRIDCIHVVPENHPEKPKGEICEHGGYLEFPTVGTGVRYLKENKIDGLIHHCPYCKPTKKYNPEPAASLGINITPTGCDTCSLDSPLMQRKTETLEVTDTKTIFKRLSKRLFGGF
jgi:hypothetical protein